MKSDSRLSLVLLLPVAGLSLFASSTGPLPLAQALEGSGKPMLTIYKVWASDEARDVSSKELGKFLEQLKKSSKKKSFRLEGKPQTEALEAGKAIKVKLPGNYEATWALEKDKEGKPAVRQTLINPKKMETIDLLKKAVTITHLERIQQKGKETFILLVEFERAAK